MGLNRRRLALKSAAMLERRQWEEWWATGAQDCYSEACRGQKIDPRKFRDALRNERTMLLCSSRNALWVGSRFDSSRVYTAKENKRILLHKAGSRRALRDVARRARRAWSTLDVWKFNNWNPLESVWRRCSNTWRRLDL